MGISDSSTWLLLLKDRRGRPSSDASSPLVSVARLWISLVLLRVATWNVDFPSRRVFSVDSRVVETLLEPRSRLGFFKPMSVRLDGSKISICKIPGSQRGR